MRKIPRELENPIDNILIDLCEPISELFNRISLTPNHITTISMIFGFLSVFFLYKRIVIVAVILYFISYLFDCVDGYYARKYNMCSKFGDLYDHIKDCSVNFLFYFGVFYIYKDKLSVSQWIIIGFISLFIKFMESLYFGAQEKYYDHLDDIPSFGFLSKMFKDT